jgi:hypothetical protein
MFNVLRITRCAVTIAASGLYACSGSGGSSGTNGSGGYATAGGSTAGGGFSSGGSAASAGAAGAGGKGDVAGTGWATNTGGASAGTGGAGGTPTGGAGGSGTGGNSSGGVAGVGTNGGMAGASGDLVWPNDVSKANSDDWLVQNHDRITQLRPRVLAIDLAKTANTSALFQKHIQGLANATSFHKFKDSNAQPALVYQVVKVVQASGPDYTTWNSQAFADSSIQMKDPADPNGPNLTLCQLFEKGVINEVWCMATQNQTKCGETQETKQVYTDTDPPQKVAGKIVGASNGDNVTGLGCKVSIRIIDFNTSRGVGCHQHAMGHGWERYMDSGALPFLRKQAARFLNWDLDTRVGAPFSNFYHACNSNGTQLTDCMIWDSEIAMHYGPSAARPFTIADMSGGCGNAHFYPNTTGTYSYDATTPDPKVLSSCEHYGMHDGANGKDTTTEFTNALTDQYASMQSGVTDDDCGGHGTSYLYQNFPNHGTSATSDDGTPMHDWWVYLFY